MARVFKIGDFYGLTAAQITYFKPTGVDAFVSKNKFMFESTESLYSLLQEFIFLQKSLDAFESKPDYEALASAWEENAEKLNIKHLGAGDVSHNKLARNIVMFYKGFVEGDEAKKAKFSDVSEEEVNEILTDFKSYTTVDCGSQMSKVSSVTKKIVSILVNNKSHISIMVELIRKALDNLNIADKRIFNERISTILGFDMKSSSKSGASSESCYHSCRFAGNFFNSINNSSTANERRIKRKSGLEDIAFIQDSYKNKKVEYTSTSEINRQLDDIYPQMSLAAFLDILEGASSEREKAEMLEDGLDFNNRPSSKDMRKYFEELDSLLIGGMSCNAKEFGATLRNATQKTYAERQSIISSRNEKLDKVLELVYKDLMSQEYMSTVR